MKHMKLDTRQINKLAQCQDADHGWQGNFRDEDIALFFEHDLVWWYEPEYMQVTDKGQALLDSYFIDHDTAHEMATAAMSCGNDDLALEMLERANRNGAIGFHSSIRTANRILNIKERMRGTSHPDVDEKAEVRS